MSDKNTPLLRQHITFSGRVQGVGFRYTAVKAANKSFCTGWVRNETGSTVTMEIQGTKDRIESVIHAIRNSKFIRVKDMDIMEMNPVPNEYDFRILR